jgi:hypothetical protein
MKKLFCVSLIKTIASCIVDLMTLKQKLISIGADAPDPSDLDSNDYFIGNRKCAEHLGVTPKTISKYASRGLLKSFHAGPFACYKISDVDEAIENVPALKAIYEARLSRKRVRQPEMTTICTISDTSLFIRLTYQGWHCLVCTSVKTEGNQPAINKLCKEVIRAYHKIKPFRVNPN